MATKRNPNEVLHLQVAPGATVTYRDHAYGDRATLQVRAGDLDAVSGKYTEVDPAAVPDVGTLPAA
jgi:hypothetical protein